MTDDPSAPGARPADDRSAVDDATSRIPPVPRPWSEEDAAGIGAWGHPAATYPPLLLTRVLQRHPTLAGKVRRLGEGIYLDGRLPARLRTVVILRTCARVGGAYEWGGQAAFWGPLCELTGDECDLLATGGPDEPAWSAAERAVITAVDQLEDTGTIADEAWAALAEHLDPEQCIEVLVVSGWYRMIAVTCNALGLGIEDWMRPWPAAPTRA